MVLIDQGGTSQNCTHKYVHAWLDTFGYIPAGFVGAGILGAFALRVAAGRSATRGLFAQGFLSFAMLFYFFFEDYGLSLERSHSSAVFLVIAAAAHQIGSRLGTPKKRKPLRAPRPTGNYYPTPEFIAP